MTLVFKLFFGYFSQARKTKAKINKCDYIHLKSICTVKEITRKTKCLPTGWEKIFANNISDKGLYPKCKRNSYNSTSNKTKQTKQKTQLKNKLRVRTDIFPKKTYIRIMGTWRKKKKKKKLNLTNHQRNANQNHNKISSNTFQDLYYQKDNKWNHCCGYGEKVILTTVGEIISWCIHYGK